MVRVLVRCWWFRSLFQQTDVNGGGEVLTIIFRDACVIFIASIARRGGGFDEGVQLP